MADAETTGRDRSEKNPTLEDEISDLRARLARARAEVERLTALRRHARNELALLQHRLAQLSSRAGTKDASPPDTQTPPQAEAPHGEPGPRRDRAARIAAEQPRRVAERNEARLREIGEYVGEVFWIANPAFTQILYMSPAYEDVWGRSLDSLQRDPRSWIDAVHPADRQYVLDALGHLKHGPHSLEFRITRPDGQVRWVRTRGSPVIDEQGRTRRIVGVTEDITDRKTAENAQRFLARAGRILGASLDYEDTLRNVARFAVPEVADWCIVDVVENGEARRLEVAYANPRNEPLARILRRYLPDPRSPIAPLRVIRTGKPQLLREIPDSALRAAARNEEHLRALRALGVRSAMIVPMIARGRTLGTIAFIAAESGRRYDQHDLAFAHDVAARAALAVDNARLFKQAEAARAAAERRAREETALRKAATAVTATYTVQEVLQEIARSAVEACNADGTAVERIDIASDTAEVVAVAGSITLPIGRRLPFAGSFAQVVLQRGKPELIPDLAASPRPAPPHWVEICPHCSAAVIPLVEAGEEIGALILLRGPEKEPFQPDEIDRARTFGQLAALAFRKVQLLEDAERSRDELVRLIESRSRLMRGFSHDVKNPLGTADGLLQLLGDGIVNHLTEEQRDHVARARRALRDALKLIQDLLDLARAEAGEITVERRPVDVRALAREAADEYRARAEAKGLTMTVELPEELPPVQSDAARVRQVLGNLVSNAVKYTQEGGVTIRVALRVSPTPRPGRWVAVEVSDTGPGIPDEERHKLFQEFQRIGRTAETSGAGIGLAISQRLAHALGGEITVETAPGKGSTFTLWLPLDAAQADQHAQARPRPAPRPASTRRAGQVPASRLPGPRPGTRLAGCTANPAPAEKGVAMPDARAALEELLDALEALDADRIGDVLAEDVVLETEVVDEPIQGKPALEEFLRTTLGAYESVRIDRRMIVASGSQAAALLRAHATFRANFVLFGETLPTAGKEVDVIGALFVETNDVGKIQRLCRVRDAMLPTQQLRISPDQVFRLALKFEEWAQRRRRAA